MTDEQTDSITIHEVFIARRQAKGLYRTGEAYSMQDYDDQGLAMLGGCHGCGESLAAYNAYPSKNGFWACRGCLGEGYASVEAFEAEQEHDQEDEPERTIVRQRALLGQIASSLANMGHVKVDLIEVALVLEDGSEFVFDLPHVLTALADDLYWDERGNWSEAIEAKVRVI